jgi:hypothetical protein
MGFTATEVGVKEVGSLGEFWEGIECCEDDGDSLEISSCFFRNFANSSLLAESEPNRRMPPVTPAGVSGELIFGGRGGGTTGGGVFDTFEEELIVTAFVEGVSEPVRCGREGIGGILGVVSGSFAFESKSIQFSGLSFAVSNINDG